jgi:hypothetical protein
LKDEKKGICWLMEDSVTEMANLAEKKNKREKKNKERAEKQRQRKGRCK